jgi:hypothetical protein
MTAAMKSLLRVLIVEDSEADTQLLLRELERSNYQITHQRVESADWTSSSSPKQRASSSRTPPIQKNIT